MSEPATAAAAGALGALGLKVATLVAGFAGAVVSLSYLTQLSALARFLAVVSGTLTAGYSEPLVSQWWGLTGPASNAIAFLIGLTSMNLVPAVVRGSEWVRDNAREIVASRLGKRDE